MGYRSAAQFDALRVIAAAEITDAYVLLGPILPERAVAVNFKNATNGIIYISTDGVTDMIAIPAGWGEAYDVRTNAPNNADFLLAMGTGFYIKYSGSAPTTGSFYLEAILAESYP